MKKKNTGRKLFVALLFYFCALYLLCMAESHSERANIKDIGDAMWYSLITLTTIGYGDFYPVTPIGKVMALLFVVGSLGLLGFIIGKATEFISDISWRKHMGHYGTSFEKHVVIVGWDSFARSIVNDLIQAGQRVAVITGNRNDIDLIYAEFSSDLIFCLFADLKNISIFEKANISKSSMILINLADDTQKLVCMLNIKKEFKNSRFVIALESSELADTFYSGGATFVMSKNEIASKLMASYIFEPDVADMTNDLLSISKSVDEYDIKEFKVLGDNPLAGKSYGEIFSELKNRYNVLPIGICKCKEKENRQLLKLPPDNTRVEAEDYIILIMSGKEEDSIKQLFNTPEGVF